MCLLWTSGRILSCVYIEMCFLVYMHVKFHWGMARILMKILFPVDRVASNSWRFHLLIFAKLTSTFEIFPTVMYVKQVIICFIFHFYAGVGQISIYLLDICLLFCKLTFHTFCPSLFLVDLKAHIVYWVYTLQLSSPSWRVFIHLKEFLILI